MRSELLWVKGSDPKEGGWPGLRINKEEFVDGMKIKRDVPVAMRDGIKLYVDIFRPESAAGLLPILLAWSPYGKHGAKTLAIFPNSGVPRGSVSRHAAWEGPDPAYFTQKGYAVINADSRGSWGSEGDNEIFSLQEAQDGYDMIEWAGTLPWSNGRVALAGVSYLAIIQWRIAELNPPHLACINPWEGFSDVYRDYSYHGGIPETNFLKFMEWSCRCSYGSIEDWSAMHKAHPLLDDYHKSKSCQDLSKIIVPAYVVADWGDQGLHLRGTLNAFTGLGSPHKWLEIHGRKKWQYYYQPSSLRRQEAFFQRFLKNEESEVDTWPRVEIEIRDRAFEGTVRAENEWPLSRTRHVPIHLNLSSGRMTNDVPQELTIASYNSEAVDDCVKFEYTFEAVTELTGGMRLRLWVATDEGDDMDLFVQLDKIDGNRSIVPFVAMAMLDDGPLALGWLRVSQRELDLSRSSYGRPWLHHRRQLLLRPNEVVPVDIEILPSSTRFTPGDSLRLTIQGNDIFKYPLPQAQLHQELVNAGKHHVYSGGIYDSYLVLPVIDSPHA
ncbi:hypothetical protein MMC08_005192 [Hypocenomyce scalaris]|nr:hypothetical protein [Hypocenomyce scalaris]